MIMNWINTQEECAEEEKTLN